VRYGKNAFHLRAAEPADLEESDILFGLVGKMRQQDAVGLLFIFPEVEGLAGLAVAGVDIAIASEDVGFFGTIAFLLAAGGLVVEAVFFFRDDQREEGIHESGLAAAVGACEQRGLSLGRDLPYMLVKGAPVEDLHVLQSESGFGLVGTKYAQLHIASIGF
jgi:hypothetical protein